MFFGCGKPEPVSNEFVMLSVSTRGDGLIAQGLHFSVGTEKLKSAGATGQQIEQFKSRLIEQVKVFHDEYYLSFLLKYANNPNDEFKIGKSVIVTQPTYTKETDTVGFNILFSSQSAWDYYHGGTEQSQNTAKVKRGFVISITQEGVFPFSAKLNNDYVAMRYINAYKNALGGLAVDYNPDFVYDYATQSTYIKSDSDYFFSDELYHHIWMKKIDELENARITLSFQTPNTPVWYATLLCITLSALGATLGIMVMFNKKRK